MNPVDAYAEAVVRGVTLYLLADSRDSDPISRVRYIGQTNRPLGIRMRAHWATARSGQSNHRAAWMRAMEHVGAAVLIEPVVVVESSEAHRTEMALIALFRSRGADLTNTTAGGEGVRGLKVSDVTRQKMRDAARRRKASAETRRKMRKALQARYATPEMKARMREIVTGRTRSPETRAKMAAARRGSGNGMAKLNEQAARAIRDRFSSGERQASIARSLSVSAATVHRIVHGYGWSAA